MGSFSYVMVSQFDRKSPPLLESILNNSIVVLEGQNYLFWHVWKLWNHLLAIGVYVVVDLHLLTGQRRKEIIDLVAVNHVDWYLEIEPINASQVWVGSIANILMNLESVRCIHREYRVSLSAEIFNYTALVIIRLKGVFGNSEDVLDSSWNYSSISASLSMESVCFSRLRWPE